MAPKGTEHQPSSPPPLPAVLPAHSAALRRTQRRRYPSRAAVWPRQGALPPHATTRGPALGVGIALRRQLQHEPHPPPAPPCARVPPSRYVHLLAEPVGEAQLAPRPAARRGAAATSLTRWQPAPPPRAAAARARGLRNLEIRQIRGLGCICLPEPASRIKCNQLCSAVAVHRAVHTSTHARADTRFTDFTPACGDATRARARREIARNPGTAGAAGSSLARAPPTSRSSANRAPAGRARAVVALTQRIYRYRRPRGRASARRPAVLGI